MTEPRWALSPCALPWARARPPPPARTRGRLPPAVSLRLGRQRATPATMGSAPFALHAPRVPFLTPQGRFHVRSAPRALMVTLWGRHPLQRRVLGHALQEIALGWAPPLPLPSPALLAFSAPLNLQTHPRRRAPRATIALRDRAWALRTLARRATFRLAAQCTLRRPAAPLARLATAMERGAQLQLQIPALRDTCARAQRPLLTYALRARIAPRALRWLCSALRELFPQAAPPIRRFPLAARAARAPASQLAACPTLQIRARRATTAPCRARQAPPKLVAQRATFAPPPLARLHPLPPLRPALWGRLAPEARRTRPPLHVARAERAFVLQWRAIRPLGTPAHQATTAPPLPLASPKTLALRATTAPRARAPSCSIPAQWVRGPLAAPPLRASHHAQPAPLVAAWQRAAPRRQLTSARRATTASLSCLASRRRLAVRATTALQARALQCLIAPRALQAFTAPAELRIKRCKTAWPAQRARAWGRRARAQAQISARRGTFAPLFRQTCNKVPAPPAATAPRAPQRRRPAP